MSHFCNWLLQLVVISIAKLFNTIFSIKPLSNDFIGLDELVNFSSKFIILVADNSYVIIHRFYLDLQIRVIFQKSRVGVASSFKLFAHIHQLVFFLTNLNLKLLDSST